MTHLGADVAAFVDDQLGAEECRRAEAHLAICPACRHRVRQEMLAKAQLTALRGVQPSTALMTSLTDLERLRSQAAAHPRSVGLGRRLVAVGSLSMAVVGATYVLTGPAQPAPTPDHATPPATTHPATTGAGIEPAVTMMSRAGRLRTVPVAWR